MKTEPIYYRIRRSDGKYSTGGAVPQFSQHGKIWSSLGRVNSHLSCLWNGNISYRECTLERLQLAVIDETRPTIADLIEVGRKRKDARKAKEDARRITRELIKLDNQKTELNRRMLELGAKLK